jgi:chaperonin GroES
VDYGSGKVLRILKRFDEQSVSKNTDDEVISIKADNYFTKFSFVPSPDGGFYDIGFGVLLGPINETINTLINQLLDSGTLSNMQAGFISRGIRIKGGNHQFEPGEWKYVNTAGDDLRKGLVPLPVREPSQVLFSLLGMMIESGEKLSSVTEVMTGEIPGQNTKATVAMAAIEQGMKVFSSIYKRIHRSLSKEYKKLFKLNSVFLPMETYFNIIDVGQEQAAKIGNSDYDIEQIDVVPVSDPNVATEQQKIAKVQALMEVMGLGQLDPQEVTRRYLEATEQPNMDALMRKGQQPPPPEVQFEMQKFQDESARAWKELEIMEMEAETKALKNIADAEAAEEGQQLQQYQGVLQTMEQQRVAEENAARQQEAHQQKMGQSDQMHQQKVQQQQQMQQLKMQQQAQRPVGGNNGGTDPGRVQ